MTNTKYPLKYKLDAYEQDLEDNFGKGKDITTPELLKRLQDAARHDLESKRSKVSARRSITIRFREDDIAAIKIKAAKKALPYQTYINMLVHQDAMSA